MKVKPRIPATGAMVNRHHPDKRLRKRRVLGTGCRQQGPRNLSLEDGLKVTYKRIEGELRAAGRFAAVEAGQVAGSPT